MKTLKISIILILFGLANNTYGQIEPTDTLVEDSSSNIVIGSINNDNLDDNYGVTIPEIKDTITIDISFLTGSITESKIGNSYDVDLPFSNLTNAIITLKEAEKDCSCIGIGLPQSNIGIGISINIPIKIEILKPGPIRNIITIYGFQSSNNKLRIIQPFKIVGG